jgi:DNA-binding transcriptional MerR regulator
MNIKAFEAATGARRTTIRFYEARGLLAPEHVGPSGYRTYGPAQVERVKTIRLAQSLGFSLSEIGALMDAWDANALDEAAQRRLIEMRLADVVAKRARLAGLEAYLGEILAWMDAGREGPKPRFAGDG